MAFLSFPAQVNEYAARTVAGCVVVLLTDKLMMAAEYKEQPKDFKPASGLIGAPDDWWTIDAGYIVNPHMTVAVGYGHFGTVANHNANSVWGLTTKWEF